MSESSASVASLMRMLCRVQGIDPVAAPASATRTAALYRCYKQQLRDFPPSVVNTGIIMISPAEPASSGRCRSLHGTLGVPAMPCTVSAPARSP